MTQPCNLHGLLVTRRGWDLRHGNEVRMIVANDGATGAGPDSYSFGLRGLAERLADAGGALHAREENGVFTLEATVPEARIDTPSVTP